MFCNKKHLSLWLTELVALNYGSSLHHLSPSGGKSRDVLKDTDLGYFQLNLKIEHRITEWFEVEGTLKTI